jgi:hypothetical protein
LSGISGPTAGILDRRIETRYGVRGWTAAVGAGNADGQIGINANRRFKTDRAFLRRPLTEWRQGYVKESAEKDRPPGMSAADQAENGSIAKARLSGA